jgi:hypothetical protein
MPRPEPAEDATFPVYRVQAVCSNKACGRKGLTNTFKKYPEGTVITTKCSMCVKSWETTVKQFYRHQPLGVIRSKGTDRDKPKHTPLEHEPHWTEKLP